MKKLFAIMTAAFVATFATFAAPLELKFADTEDGIEILNFNEEGKTICDDNVRFLNKTSSDLYFEVYGKKDKDFQKDFLCSVTVEANDTQLESCKKDVGNFKYIYVVCKTGNATFSKVTCQHSDMYFYVSDVEKTVSVSVDFSKYQQVVQHPGCSKENIYNGILSGCVNIFNKSTFVIEYKDKETGVVKGKAQHTPNWSFYPTTYYFTFTFEARDNRFRVTFDDLEFDTGTKHFNRKGYGESEYNEMRPMFEDAIRSINECIKPSDSDDW